jgi:hypothetical protein
MRKKKGSSWAALKKHLQQCYKYSEPEDDADNDTSSSISQEEFGTSTSDGVGLVSGTGGQPRLDYDLDKAAIDSPAEDCHEPSTSDDSISEYVDEELQEEDQDEVIQVKQHRNRSLAEQLALPNVSSPVLRLTCSNGAPGAAAAPCPPGLRLEADGGAAVALQCKNVYRSGSVPKKPPASNTRAGAVQETADSTADTAAVGMRGRCRVPGKLSQSRRRGSTRAARGAKLEKSSVVHGRRFHTRVPAGTGAENAHTADCATSWSDYSSSSQGRLIRRLEKELEIHEPTLCSVSTRMSRTGPRRPRMPARTDPHPRAAAAAAAAAAFGNMKHGWNASTRTAQDFQALLRDKERAVMKRERALKYARSIRRTFRHGHARQKGEPWPAADAAAAGAAAAARTPADKPGWVWSWLERAARMGANGARDNRIFDNDSDPRNGISDSALSVQSTIAMCTTGPIPAADAVGAQCSSDHVDGLWLPAASSLREQQEAKAQCVNLPANHATSRADQPGMGIKSGSGAHPDDDAQEQNVPREENRTSSREEPRCSSAAGVAKFKVARFGGTRGSCLSSWTNQVAEGREKSCILKDENEDDDSQEQYSPVESVGSCAAPVPIRASKYTLSSHFNGGAAHRVKSSSGGTVQQLKMLQNSNLQSRGVVESSFLPVARPSAAAAGEYDADSIGSTATSLRKKLWKP